MRFNCLTGKLIEGLQIVTRALSARTTNPILEGVKIQAEEGEILLTCSDERITIVTRVKARVEEEGSGVVPGKLFNEIVRRLPEGEVDVSMNERFVFTLKASGSRTTLAGQDADLFPALPQIDGEREVTLPQEMLRDMIQKTEFAIAQEDMREVLTGCYLEIAGGDVNMVALDGFRMALRQEKCSDVLENVSAIIPGRAVGDIGKLLSSEEDAYCSLSFGGNKLHIRLENTDIFVILVEGEYIKYRQILPTQFSTRVRADLEMLRRCIDRAALMAREGANNLIRFEIQEDSLVIESNSEMGDVHEEMEIECEGDPLVIAFNVKYMTDVVRSMDCARVEMNFNNSVSPCVITPEGEQDYLHLVLPVRLHA